MKLCDRRLDQGCAVVEVMHHGAAGQLGFVRHLGGRRVGVAIFDQAAHGRLDQARARQSGFGGLNLRTFVSSSADAPNWRGNPRAR